MSHAYTKYKSNALQLNIAPSISGRPVENITEQRLVSCMKTFETPAKCISHCLQDTALSCVVSTDVI
jgi:hypothetical protein